MRSLIQSTLTSISLLPTVMPISLRAPMDENPANVAWIALRQLRSIQATLADPRLRSANSAPSRLHWLFIRFHCLNIPQLILHLISSCLVENKQKSPRNFIW